MNGYEFRTKLSEIAPDYVIEKDNDGQIVIYTGLRQGGEDAYLATWRGSCDDCGFEYDLSDRVKHCGECGTCWTHCVQGEPHYDEKAIGVKDRDYGLNEQNELEWVDIRVTPNGSGLLFTSLLDGATYEVNDLTLADLDRELRDLGGSDFTDELLTMVAEMGGGIWPEPDGTSTEYHLDTEAGLLTVIER